MGILSADEFNNIKQSMMQQKLERNQAMSQMDEIQRKKLMQNSVILIQRMFRGMIGRRLSISKSKERLRMELQTNASILIQIYARQMIAKAHVNKIREIEILRLAWKSSVEIIQRVWRGKVGRNIASLLKRDKGAVLTQRVFRGAMGRRVAAVRREARNLKKLQLCASIKVCMFYSYFL